MATSIHQLDFMRSSEFHRGNLRIALVAPALESVPATGWGAVEQVVHEQSLELLRQGFDVCILNSGRWRDWGRVFAWRPHVLFVHYEGWLERAYRWRELSGTPVLACGHYGLLQWPERWNEGFSAWFDLLMQADGLIALNPGIKELLLKRGYPAHRVFLAPNGSNEHPVRAQRRPRGVISLGKVEERKRQFESYSALKPLDFRLVFAGPIADERVQNLLNGPRGNHEPFVGPWSRTEVMSGLADFSALLLNSTGEADPLVLYEAQLAGLSIVVSREALGAQDPSLPWVHVIEGGRSEHLRDAIAAAVTTNDKWREEIINHANRHYRWSTRIAPIVRGLQALLPQNHVD